MQPQPKMNWKNYLEGLIDPSQKCLKKPDPHRQTPDKIIPHLKLTFMAERPPSKFKVREDFFMVDEKKGDHRRNNGGYAALNEMYSLANAEYYQGKVDFNKGLLTSGNEALAYLAKAATAFTRSQAHALQVYEALVPAPTCPSDLGLRPFGGQLGCLGDESWRRKVKRRKPVLSTSCTILKSSQFRTVPRELP